MVMNELIDAEKQNAIIAVEKQINLLFRRANTYQVLADAHKQLATELTMSLEIMKADLIIKPKLSGCETLKSKLDALRMDEE